MKIVDKYCKIILLVTVLNLVMSFPDGGRAFQRDFKDRSQGMNNIQGNRRDIDTQHTFGPSTLKLKKAQKELEDLQREVEFDRNEALKISEEEMNALREIEANREQQVKELRDKARREEEKIRAEASQVELDWLRKKAEIQGKFKEEKIGKLTETFQHISEGKEKEEKLLQALAGRKNKKKFESKINLIDEEMKQALSVVKSLSKSEIKKIDEEALQMLEISQFGGKTKDEISFLANANMQATEEDPQVIVDYTAVAWSSDLISCPFGYTMVKNGNDCGSRGCDLNKGAIGVGDDDVFLCERKKLFSELVNGEMPINRVEIMIASTDCGDLKKVDMDLNKGTKGKVVTLCYGYDPNVELSAIASTYIFYSDNKLFTQPFNHMDCALRDLNENAGGKFIYFCAVRNPTCPREYEVTNMTINEAQKKIVSQPEMKFHEFVIDNGGPKDMSATKSFQTTDLDSTQVDWSVKASIAGKYKGKMVEAELKFSFGYTWSNTDTTNKQDKTDFTCTAPAGSYYRCNFYTKSAAMNIPFTYSRITTYINGTKSAPKQITGLIKGVRAQDIYMKACCYQFCTEKDVLCTGVTLKDKNVCPKLTGENAPSVQNTVTKLPYDPVVMVDVKTVNSSSENTSCPPNYTKLQHQGCGQYGCDFNMKGGGNYIYMCILYKKMSQITPDETPINEYSILLNNDDCGILKNAGVDLNYKAGGEKIYACFGNDPTSTNAPLTGLFMNIKDGNTVPQNYKCDSQDLNQGAGIGSKYIYLCVTRDAGAPKSVEITNYSIGEIKRTSFTKPTVLDMIQVSGSTITKTVTNTVTKTIKNSNSYEFSFTLGKAVSALGVEKSVTATAGASYLKAKTSTKIVQDSLSTACIAPAGTTIRCTFFSMEISGYAAYTADASFYKFDNSLINTTKITGYLNDVSSDSASMKICCLENCGPTDTKCADADKCFAKTRKFRKLLKKYK